MKLKARLLGLTSGGKMIVILNNKTAKKLAVKPLERVIVKNKKEDITCIVNTSEKIVKPREIIIYDDVNDILKIKNGDIVDVRARPFLNSKKFIRERIRGKELTNKKIRQIVDDVLEHKLSDLALASLISSFDIRPLSDSEAYGFTKAMIDTSEKFTFRGKIVDKHSIGGIPGDKTSILVVSIVAAAGLTIPKSSSRAITDPAGTADRFEIFAPVQLDARAIRRTVKKTGGCIIWGGSFKLAPADDLFIQIEHPLDSDAMMIPSIIAKKKVMGSKYVILDMPMGPTQAKIKDMSVASKLARKFIKIGKRFGMKIECAVTNASQPLGYSMGPALEARDILNTFSNSKSKDLIDKATSLAGILFKMVGKDYSAEEGKARAVKIFNSGLAEKKFREIIKEQGGNEKVTIGDIRVGKETRIVKAKKSGYIHNIHNKNLVRTAIAAGCPGDKGAGIELFKKIGDKISHGEPLFKIYAENKIKMKNALSAYEDSFIIKSRRPKKTKMLLKVVV